MITRCQLLLAALLLCTPIFGQQYTSKLLQFSYEYYPTVTGFEDATTINLEVKGLAGNYYTLTINKEEGDPKSLFIQDYIEGMQFHRNAPQILIRFEQLSRTNERAEVVEIVESEKVKKYVYKLSVNESYKVQLLDAKKRNAVIKEYIVQTKPSVQWPDISKGGTAFNSAKLLEKEYANQLKTQPTFKEDLEKRWVNSSINQASVRSQIQQTIHSKVDEFNYWITYPTVQDPNMNQKLERAGEYLLEGIKMHQQMVKSGDKGNLQTSDIKGKLTEAHQIFQEYVQKEQWKHLEGEVEQEIARINMIANLYFTATMIEDFDLATQLYRLLMPDDRTTYVDANNNSLKGEKVAYPNAKPEEVIDRMKRLRQVELYLKDNSAVLKSRYQY